MRPGSATERATGAKQPYRPIHPALTLAAKALGKVFQPFATTKPTGTGLGLAIVQKVIVSHNGSIAAANHPPNGAQFRIRLPLAKTGDWLEWSVPLADLQRDDGAEPGAFMRPGEKFATINIFIQDGKQAELEIDWLEIVRVRKE